MHLGGLAFRQHGEKLIASQTDGDVGAANRFLQQLGELSDHLVAGRMAKRIVDVFQPVEVQEKNGQRAAITMRTRNFFGEALFAGPAGLEDREWGTGGDIVLFSRSRS